MTQCINGPEGCEGEVYERESLSGSGMTFARCDKHYNDYVDRIAPRLAAIRERYPDSDVAPAWFDPMAAGERWNDDDPWP